LAARCPPHLGHRQGAFPVAERLAAETLALPVVESAWPRS
jgi:hypothetical protein